MVLDRSQIPDADDHLTTPVSTPVGPATRASVTSFDNYDVIETLGTGGMGRVLRARHRLMEREVAIKTLRGELNPGPALADRFKQEARALAALDHENIVKVYDFGQTREGVLFLVMELVSGSTLRGKLRGGALPFKEAVSLMRQICAGLGKAHAAGIVHRDLKPENILIGADGRARVADFGLAITHRADAPAQHAEGPAGTVVYMAPEQKNGAAITQATDVYALGLIFYELLTGRVPEGVFELPSSITGCPKQVDQILRRCLQAEPSQRYSNAAQIDDALSRCDPAAPTLIARGNRRALWTATALLALLLCGLAAWIVQKVPEKIVNLLAEQRSMHVQGGSASREPDGTLSLQMGNPLRIQLGIDPSELPGAPGDLAVKCTSSASLQGFEVLVKNEHGVWKYTHPKAVKSGTWDTVITADKFVRVEKITDIEGALAPGSVTLVISPAPDAAQPATMVMSELSVKPAPPK